MRQYALIEAIKDGLTDYLKILPPLVHKEMVTIPMKSLRFTWKKAEGIPNDDSKDPARLTYVVECADGTLYTGYTTDVGTSPQTHNSQARGAKYTRARPPVKLLYSEAFASKPSHELQRHLRKKEPRENWPISKNTRKITVCFDITDNFY